MGSHNKKKNKTKKAKHQNKLQKLTEDGDESLGLSETVSGSNEDAGPQKRYHDEQDSDSETVPRKKIKKKLVIVPDDNTTDKKNKKSIRQMKKEKFAQRQAEMQAASKDQLKSQCLNYLSQWKHDKSNWKFMKAKQVWLYKNKFSQSLVPDGSWPLLMEYFESAQGNIRNMLLDDANKIIKQMDDWTESQNEESEEQEVATEDDKEVKAKPAKPDDTTYKRARDLIQCLQE